MQQIEELRGRKAGPKAAGGSGETAGPSSLEAGPSKPEPGAQRGEGEVGGKLVLPKRRRVIDVLQEALAASDGSGHGTDESDGEEGGGLIMDWRAKTV